MGVDMELEFEKYCKVGRSPRTVLPLRYHQKGGNRDKKEKPCSRNENFELISSREEGFTEIKLCNYRSVSCKSLPSRKVELEGDALLKRGSVYQSLGERKLRRPESLGGRKKIEYSLRDDTSFSFDILDSICGSDEESEHLKETRSSLISPSMEEAFSRDMNERQTNSSMYAQRDSMDNNRYKCDQVTSPSNSANTLVERDGLVLPKSLSAKLALPHSPTHFDSDCSRGSSKIRFSPIRKMFDPLMKSKSHRTPLSSSSMEYKGSRSSSTTGGGRNKTPRKSLMTDFSSTVQPVDTSCESVKKDSPQILTPHSPAHLHGDLKMEQKHGVPYYEFSLAHSEEVFMAKTWKSEDALSWVYTFHSFQGRKRSNTGGRGLRYSNKDSPMVGQMQVSCYQWSELKDSNASSNSMVTEFVLYDIAHARKPVTAVEEIGSSDVARAVSGSNEGLGQGSFELDDLFVPMKPRAQVMSARDHVNLDFSSPYPWATADLHPGLETAAVVIQVPFEKRESLKYRRGDKLGHQVHSSLLDVPQTEQEKKGLVKVSVVTPLGNHGLPSIAESRGPSSLLDRWRLGGGCDCGGWDMACPLVVFGNHGFEYKERHPLLEKERPLELFAQGAKEKKPSLTITITEKGHYAIDFHAQLSTLQAFAICVAVLHSTEASSMADQEKNKQLLQCSSLQVLVEDEVKILIEAVADEEKKKSRRVSEENPPSFVLNPPFSPIARV